MKSMIYLALAWGLLPWQSGTWEYYVGTPYIDHTNAAEYHSFDSTPESVVAYFYASKIRNDKTWLAVVPQEGLRSIRLAKKLERYEYCTFTRFRLIGKKAYAEGKIWIKVYMEMEYAQKKGNRVDEVLLDFVDDRWVITSLPA